MIKNNHATLLDQVKMIVTRPKMHHIGCMGRIIDEPPGQKILKKSSISSFLYQLGYKFGLVLTN